MMLIKEFRKEALMLGFDHYFTGKPCRLGHISEGYTRSGACIECENMRSKRLYAENPKKKYEINERWRANNPERVRKNWRNASKRRRAELAAAVAKFLPCPCVQP